MMSSSRKRFFGRNSNSSNNDDSNNNNQSLMDRFNASDSSMNMGLPTHMLSDGSMDGTWSGPSTRRRGNSSDNISPPLSPMSRSMSGGGGVRRTMSSTRQRSSGNSRGGGGSNDAVSITVTPTPTRSVKRNLTGDFQTMFSSAATTNAAAVARSNSNRSVSPPSHHTPYGMLNPGPMHSSSSSRRWNKRSYYSTSSSSSSSSFCGWVWPRGKQLVALCGLVTLGIMAVTVYQHDAQLHQALSLKEELVLHHQQHAKELERRVQGLREETEQLEDKVVKLQELPSSEKIDLETQRKLFYLEHDKLRVQQGIQTTCKRLVKEKYGKGPHYYVEMKLQFDKDSNVYNEQESGDRMVIETASIEHMPHAVYLFLEQVSHGLYDGTTFHRNAAHLVQAGPSANSHKHAHFRHEPSLNSVMFQEYTPEVAHKQYTLGYPGRPGGPDFYINMRDNSFLHGPGGQANHYSDMITDADPCFAKIVEGYEACERIHRSEVQPGGFHDAMIHPVTIVKMTVLKDYVKRDD